VTYACPAQCRSITLLHTFALCDLQAGVPVSPFPGPSAVTAALSVCGFRGPTERGFVFVGFAPRPASDRTKLFNWILSEPRAVVVFEAPTRMEGFVVDLATACAERGQVCRRVCIGRELTKMHEEIFRGSVADGAEWVRRSPPRGEYVIVIEGATVEEPSDSQASLITEGLRIVDMLVTMGLKPSEAIKRAAAVTNVPKSELYDAVVKRK
jgi:16S rRNA (cytidine1402-2'-O)-methyltransferase